MTRLYVLGCSFSNYAWPTWADMLGLEYDTYENWAFPGLGNRAIAERVAEIHARNNQQKTILLSYNGLVVQDMTGMQQIIDIKITLAGKHQVVYLIT